MQVKLKHGLKIADTLHMAVTMRSPVAGDLLKAREAAEVLRVAPNGVPLMVSSNVLYERALVCRLVLQIGNVPFVETFMDEMHPKDYEVITNTIDGMIGGSIAAAQLEASRRSGES